MNKIKNLSVIGAGLMGHGIALKFAQAGTNVIVHDNNKEVLSSLIDRIRQSYSQMGVSENEIEIFIKNINISDDLNYSVKKADLVIEAISEKLELKQEIFFEVEKKAPLNCVISSNTSVIPITKIVKRMSEKSRGLGTHWWNPPHLIPLVEVIKTEWTSVKVIDLVMFVLKKIGKTPVRVEKDIPGFIGNRLQHALWREAISLIENNVCDAEAVDTVIKSSFGRRLAVLGPIENADLVGTDLTLDVHENVLFDLESSKEPSKLLRKLVNDGKLGMKSGEGFQKWTKNEIENTKKRVSTHLRKLEKII
mgnify:CR=1 FL=1